MNEEIELTPEEEAEMEEAKRKAEEAQAELEKSVADGTFVNGFVQPTYEEKVAQKPKSTAKKK